MPGRVRSIGAESGRNGLVGAAQLNARIPRVRVCEGRAQVAVQKKKNCLFDIVETDHVVDDNEVESEFQLLSDREFDAFNTPMSQDL